MDFVSFPSFFLSAPTRPFGCSPEHPMFYRTWSSPVPPFGSCSSAVKTSDDDFQFATGWDQEEHKYRLPARVNSCSAFAFADELFSSGQVLPLKLPPRLQTSVPTSPTRSLSSRVRNPFPQRCTWNDGFDPFMNALEKVSEETEGRTSVHRRSRSYSPFRKRTSISCTVDWDHDQEKELTVTEVMDRKGSMYSKWVRSQALVKSPTPKSAMKKLWLGRRVRDASFSHNEPMKQTEPASCKESKMKKVKSVLLRYASLKKEIGKSNQAREIITVSKVSYFKQLSLSFKINRRKKESADGKMALVKHDMKLSRFVGYVPASPKWL